MARLKKRNDKKDETITIKCLIYYINYFILIVLYNHREDIHMSDTTTYIIKGINKETWRKFRASALIDGYGSAAELLRDMIDSYVMKEPIK